MRETTHFEGDGLRNFRIPCTLAPVDCCAGFADKLSPILKIGAPDPLLINQTCRAVPPVALPRPAKQGVSPDRRGRGRYRYRDRF